MIIPVGVVIPLNKCRYTIVLEDNLKAEKKKMESHHFI